MQEFKTQTATVDRQHLETLLNSIKDEDAYFPAYRGCKVPRRGKVLEVLADPSGAYTVIYESRDIDWIRNMVDHMLSIADLVRSERREYLAELTRMQDERAAQEKAFIENGLKTYDDKSWWYKMWHAGPTEYDLRTHFLMVYGYRSYVTQNDYNYQKAGMEYSRLEKKLGAKRV